ncbi:MAG: protein kinase [Desulfovibrio sp.]|nr:protein kinase [Desulfovibrio sp.]
MRTIGGYRIRGLLGKGGMGAVYKAEHPALGKLVALKLLAPSEHLAGLVGYEPLKERFLREARIMAGIRHPHVSQVWDYGEDAGRPFFVMEYACDSLGSLMGESYRMEAPSRQLPPVMAMDYAIQTLSGLARLHHAGIIHRDIKPFNLLLTEENRIKIIDFGLSKLRGETARADPDTVKIGTPYYAAPEQAENPEAAGPAADCYAVGVLLWRMLVGMLPPDEMEGDEAKAACLRRDAFLARWKDLDPALAQQAREFFAVALHRDPQGRHATAMAMAADIEALRERFQHALDAACRLPEEDQAVLGLGGLGGLGGLRDLAQGAASSTAVALRSSPLKTGPLRDLEQLELDCLGRPLVPRRPEFICDARGDTVLDPIHGLRWQRAGTPYPGTWQEAHAYVAQLNNTCFAGHDDWRLPTVAELASCIDPDKEPGVSCADTCFDPHQTTCWSADRRSFVSAWRLHAAMGFVQWVDMHCQTHTRAVRTESPPHAGKEKT